MVNMIVVQSQNLEKIGYSPTEGRLFIKFRASEKLYAYSRVPIRVWRGLRKAASKNSFFRDEILGHYSFEVIESVG